VLAILPHGSGTVTLVEGGLEIPNDEGTNSTVVSAGVKLTHVPFET
jgi:hypothetical protein